LTSHRARATLRRTSLLLRQLVFSAPTHLLENSRRVQSFSLTTMYSLSSTCELTVRPDDLTIVIKNRKSTIEIPAKRWKKLMCCVDDIEEAVKQLKNKQYVKYREHIGASYYISVTTGYYCVDIRRFIGKLGDDENIRPTYDGLALRLPEWNRLVETFSQLQKDHPAMDEVKLCMDGLDHQNQMGYFDCPECCPPQYRPSCLGF